MKVKVNRTTVELFEGAKVRQALLQYCVRRRFPLSLVETADVYDSWGHRIDLDAPLYDGKTIKCKINR